MTRFFKQATRLAATLAGLMAVPAFASAQRPLVYCPVGIDETGCSAVVNALGGADRGYDGSMGTVDLRTADLGHYTVLVIPSLADDGASTPYALLRDAEVAARLRGLLLGRLAFWSGTPDLGSASRAEKDALIQRLAAWAGGNHELVNAPGLVALQDRSADVYRRYSWVEALTGRRVVADPALRSYSSVRSLTAIGVELVAGAAYSNMASLGFYLPEGAAGLSLDAVGNTGTSIGGQIVLATSPGGNTGSAKVWTDKDDYAPHEALTIWGSGFSAGETVSLTLTEDPEVHDERSFTVTADAQGSFGFEEFRPDDHDAGVRFVVTAVGQTSGVRAQTTFTDAIAVGLSSTASNSASGIGSQQLTISAPAVGIGDVLIAQIAIADDIASTFICPPSGWTSIRKNLYGTQIVQETFWFRASAAAAATSHTWQFRTNSCTGGLIEASKKGASGGITRFTGVIPTGDPVDVAAATNSTSSGGYVAPSVTTTTPDARIFHLIAVFKNTTITSTVAPVEPRMYHVSSSTTKERAVAAFDGGIKTPAGATAVFTATLGSSAEMVSQTIALKAGPTVVSFTITNNVHLYDGTPKSVTVTSSPAGVAHTVTYSQGGVTVTNPTNAGTYDVLVQSNDPMYQGSQSGTLTISKRAITVAANAVAKTYGDLDPALTYQVTSGALLGSDAFTGALTRAAGEDVGSYAIQQGTLTAGGNYDLTFVGAILTIGARAITVTADNQAKTYGDADPALTYQITSGSLVAPDAFAGVLTRAAGEDVGTYAIQQGTLALSANYQLTFVGANLTVGQRTVTATADPQSKMYGDADPALTYQVTSGSLAYSDAFTGALSRVAGENVGSHAIEQGTLALSGNYDLTFVGASLTIGQRAVTVTADPQSKMYGDADPALTYDVTSGSLVFGDAFSGALSRVAGENVGSHAIEQGTLALGSNYDLTFVGASLTIGQRAVTVTADPQSKMYGDADPALTYQVTSGSLVFGDAFSGALSRVAGENVGSHAIEQGTLALSANYDLTFVGASLTIGQRAVTVTADPQSKVYGDADPALTYQVTSGSLVFGDAFSGALSRVAGENVGAHAIEQGTLALSGNYDLTFVGASLTIGQRAVTVTADPQSKVYGNADPTLTHAVTSGSLVNGDLLSGSLAREAGEDVGTYAIQQGTLTAGANYDLTFVGANLTIGQRAVIVTADPQSKVYGDADPTLTHAVTGGSLVNGDLLSGSLARQPGENVGSYAIQQGTLTAGANYDLTFVGANLTIGQRSVTVTADPQSKTYGDADPTLTHEVTSGNLVNGDVLAGSLARELGEDVGSYAIQQGTLTAGANYDLTFVGASLTIGERAVTVTADAQSKMYGDADPALTYQITSGSLAFSDAFSGALSRVAGENVGSHAIEQGTLALSGNYDLTFVGASLTIGQRAVTVAADPQSKVYGDADPALTYAVTSGSLVFGDAFSGALSRVAGENVGSHAIEQGTLALSGNYDLTFVGASLTIGQRAVTVTADPQSKVYGDADPALTYGVTSGSLAFGDAFSGALSRVAGENVGAHAIEQGTLALSNNYDLTFVGANLTIGQRAVTVTADPLSKTYGNADPTLTHEVTSGNLVNGDLLSGSLTREAGENVGSYAIQQGTLTAGANYDLTFVGASLTIGQRAVTVTADPQSKTYGDADPALTYQVTSGSLAFSDAFSGALSRVAGENFGSHAIEQGTLALSSNYDLTFVGASLMIGQRSVTVTADPQSKVYGDADPALTYQVTSGSLVFGDAFSGALSRVASENVGPHAIEQGTLALSSNYHLTFVGASLTIGQRAVTVTADPQSKVYGDADPALTYQVTSGSLVVGDAFSGALSRVAGENVGSHAIEQGTLALSGNYDLTFVGASLTIGQRAVTVTADAQSKTYGDADPALTHGVTSGSLVSGDVLTGSLTREAGEDVGSYAIQQGTLAAGANYDLTFVGASLTIDPRAVTVAAYAKSKTYGQPDPELTHGITSGSLVNGDVVSGTLVRASGENVGTYAITQGTLALSSNYTLSFTGANLQITPAALTITAETTEKAVGEPNPPFGVTYQGFVNGDNSSALGGSLVLTFSGVSPTTYGPSATPPQTRGNYSIKPSGLTSSNYTVTFVNGYYAINGVYFLFLDDDAIRKGPPPSGFTAPNFTDSDLNTSKARIGMRDPLAWFASSANRGKIIDLPSGQVGDEGWFTMQSVPATWAAAGPTNNGLRNLLRAGPGLGGGTNREALLDKIPEVTPLRATGLKQLEGSKVCAIVWKSDLSINYGPLNGSLKGDNRGIVAFEVVSVTQYGTGSTLPRVRVKILDPSATSGVCSEPLALHTEAPAPTSSSSPVDVNPR